MEKIIMSQKEIKRYDIIMRLIRGEIEGPKTAALLHLSTRQVRRIKGKVKKHGASGLIHGNREKSSNRKTPEKERQKIVNLLHKYYYDFQPTHATEKLVEEHQVKRDAKTVRAIMIAEELWKPRRERKAKDYRRWRARKEYYGEMGQFDGSYHHWFGEQYPKSCLLADVDDATGAIIKAKFAEDEGVQPVFDFWKAYVLIHGKPRSIYLDKFSTYKMNSKFAKENHDLKTQFERAMEELQIDLITAHSPQAKGRIERLFGTLQNRLVKELRLRKITDIEKANQFLDKKFISKFNKQFAVKSAKKSNLHCQLKNQERKKLDAIFSRQEKRIIRNDFTISYDKQWYQLTKEQPVTVCKKDKVIIEKRLDDSLHIRLRGKYLNYVVLPKRPEKQKSQPWVIAASAPIKRKTYRPPANHPWRNFHYSSKQSTPTR